MMLDKAANHPTHCRSLFSAKAAYLPYGSVTAEEWLGRHDHLRTQTSSLTKQ
jgi:hypothetical protein